MSSLWAHERHYNNRVIYPDEYLNHLGYLDNGHGFWMHTRSERRAAIRLYQKQNGLKQTGKIDKKTWQLMKTPRCAVPDFGVISLVQQRSTHNIQNGVSVRKKRAALNGRIKKAVSLGVPFGKNKAIKMASR
ncbi:matrix metalloproteinase 9 [Plakobranchus ocellatus]|uniref:Matrix metalloproteinase 9 n=1 Tax=Plakobranchus ocellatus TaxID=259542 RepID=A0AAV3ZG03_9GAST|nr:matrix metalloproteinase 9 [Plakobranchus ocellatus]